MILFIPLSLWPQEFYNYFDVGDVGVEISTYDINYLDSFYISLPSFYLREKYTHLGAMIKLGEIKIPLTRGDSPIYTIMETSVFYSPFYIGDLNLLGPFMEVAFIANKSDFFNAKIGLRFAYGDSSFPLFKNKRLPGNLILRSLDIELGYSLVKKYWYFSFSTDIVKFLEYLPQDFKFEMWE